jgi:hypothetical protein
MDWLDFLNMVTKLEPSSTGALLQGKTSWIAFSRKHVRYILEFAAAPDKDLFQKGDSAETSFIPDPLSRWARLNGTYRR